MSDYLQYIYIDRTKQRMRRAQSTYLHKPIKISHYQYSPSQRIGNGANSQVFSGTDLLSGKKVAIKKIQNLKTKFEETLLKNQLNSLKNLHHENILQFKECIEKDNITYIFTELCEMTLADLIKRSFIEQEKAIGLFYQIVCGQAEIRKQQFLHRDLKPDNIFISQNKVKIGDFGYSIQSTKKFIYEKQNVGSPIYMAPEVLQKNTYSEASDIWSLGIIFYQLLSQQLPFRGTNQKNYLENIKVHKFKRINCSQSSWDLIQSCLAMNLEDRPNIQFLKHKLQKMISSQKDERKNTKQQLERRQQQMKLQESSKICKNEVLFLSFLERMISLARQSETSQKNKIIYLYQYYANMRLNYLNTLFSRNNSKNQESHQRQTQENSILKPFSQKFASVQFQDLHLSSQDRMQLFSEKSIVFKQSTIWQAQACLKDIIQSIWKEIRFLKTEEQVAIKSNTLILFDFLMTTFQLNGLLIEFENNGSQFVKNSYLSLIMTCPLVMNLKIYMNIEEKYKKLKFQS